MFFQLNIYVNLLLIKFWDIWMYFTDHYLSIDFTEIRCICMHVYQCILFIKQRVGVQNNISPLLKSVFQQIKPFKI